MSRSPRLRRSLTAVVVATCMALSSVSLVAASSRSNAARPVEGRDPASATIVLKATVTNILEGRRIALQPEQEGSQPVEVELLDDVRIRAQNKKEFDGRKKLLFDDLAVGQKLRITVLPAQERIVSLVVLKGGDWLNT